jgi:RNA polymerase sigma-70 factor (ECF subfamily)
MSTTDQFSSAKTFQGIQALPAIQGEAILAAKISSGEADAFNELFLIYFDRLYSLVYHEIGRDQTVAEDIVQETFLSALKSAKNFKGNSQVYTWLVGIAHHKIADYYRHLKRERGTTSLSQDDPPPQIAELAANDPSAANLVEAAEVKLMVEQALQKLPLDYRQVLLLKYIEDLPVHDVCRIMNRSPKSIEGLLTRARKALRETIGDHREG